MTIESFQRFIETFCPSACVPVDLVKIARNVLLSNIGPRVDHDFRYQPPEIIPSPLCLVMDGECCLDRLYGGFFGDWVCGGQWNRMVDFLRTFFQVANKRNIEITVFFNGAFEPHRMDNWIEKQNSEKEKISQVLRHAVCKGTPPPKVWWVAPSALRTCLRIVLRHLKVNVVLTTTDHHQEVMSYLKKYNYHGLLADDPEYIIFDPPRYFSAVQLKLTFKGCLETKEYILNEVTRCLNLHPSRICIVAALLGNHIITDTDLATFHRSLCPDSKTKITPNTLIKAVVDYVRNLPSVDDLNEVAWQVFGSATDERCEKFKQCVLYYCRGSRNIGSHLSNTPASFSSSVGNANFFLESDEQHNIPATRNEKPEKSPLLPTPGNVPGPNAISHFQANEQCLKPSLLGNSNADCSKFASETDENEMSSLQSIRQVLGKTKRGAYYHLLSNEDDSEFDDYKSADEFDSISNHKDHSFKVEDSTGLESSFHALSMGQNNTKVKTIGSKPVVDVPPLPKVSTEVLRMARERHQKGLMHPYIFQILSQGEIKIPVAFEDDFGNDLPTPSLVYKPLRQMIYALLFNHHHLQYLAEQKKEKEGVEEAVPDILIKEWVWSKANKYNKPEVVPSMALGWPVPTVTRLWFGSGPDDNKKRLQAFLTCMRSNTPQMCDPGLVPQHMIILCCVLRYLISAPEMPFIHKHELDAFLVQAVDPQLMDTEYTQKLEVPFITPRGIMLATIFMQGVEHALIANDACGAPISWLMCCPWLFFDGKIFHRKLLKANAAKNLMDLCDNHYEEVLAVERMRSAIVDGVSVQFLPTQVNTGFRRPHPSFPNFPTPVQPIPQGRGRGHQRVVPRGGQLEVAGVVVGSWGPNYGQGPRSPSRNMPPQVVSVGGVGRGRGNANHGVGRGLNAARGSSPPTRLRASPPSARRPSPLYGFGRGTLMHGAKRNSEMDFDL